MNRQYQTIPAFRKSIKSALRSCLWIIMALLFAYPVAAQHMAHTLEKPKSNAEAIIDELRSSNSELADKLYQIYQVTKKYMDVEVALADGYIRDPKNMCEEAPMMGLPAFMGNMGVHYVHPELLKITGDTPRVNGDGIHIDFMRPGVLIYEPQHDGSMELVAIENLVFREAWYAAGNDQPPHFMGYEYFLMVNNPLTEADEAHMFEPHYDLHMWLYRKNPHGLFLPFNPAVSCEYHKSDGHGH